MAVPKAHTNNLKESLSFWQFVACITAPHWDECVCIMCPELTVRHWSLSMFNTEWVSENYHADWIDMMKPMMMLHIQYVCHSSEKSCNRGQSSRRVGTSIWRGVFPHCDIQYYTSVWELHRASGLLHANRSTQTVEEFYSIMYWTEIYSPFGAMFAAWL